MYKVLFWSIVLVFGLTCSTSKSEQPKKVALFFRVCDNHGQNCEVYLPTKRLVDTTSLDVREFVLEHKNAFVGERSANYSFLSYLSKDTITIFIHK